MGTLAIDGVPLNTNGSNVAGLPEAEEVEVQHGREDSKVDQGIAKESSNARFMSPVLVQEEDLERFDTLLYRGR